MSNNTEFCCSELQTTEKTFIWMIDQFSCRPHKNGEYLESNKFTAIDVDGRKQQWQIKMYPNGADKKSADQISIYFKLANDSYKSNTSKLEFAIQNSKKMAMLKKHLFVKSANRYYEEEFGISDFVKKEFIFDTKNGLLPDDKLTIECKIYNIKESMTSSENMPKIDVPQSRIAENIGTLFGKSADEFFSDCIIVSADNKQFKVHKNILSCRSPVFAAMFQHGMTEARNHTVKIPDFDSVVLGQMLQFIYNENAVNCANIGDQLLAAADKYQLEGLKVYCERELSQLMRVENACQILILATFHSAEQLKFYALEYIRKHSMVKDTEGWKMLGKEHLDMLGQR